MIRRRYRTSLLITITLLMLACVPTLPTLPGSAPLPTIDPNSPITAIVETAGAAATQTARFAPTETPTITPTRTPSITPSPTPTFLFLVPPTLTVPPTMMPVGSSGLEYDCQVLSVEPADPVEASSSFTARWLVANVGNSAWDRNDADYRYTDGYRMHIQNIYDFEASISPGVTAEFTVAMQAPPSSGTYSTSWRITIGQRRFCPMDLTITVP